MPGPNRAAALLPVTRSNLVDDRSPHGRREPDRARCVPDPPCLSPHGLGSAPPPLPSRWPRLAPWSRAGKSSPLACWNGPSAPSAPEGSPRSPQPSCSPYDAKNRADATPGKPTPSRALIHRSRKFDRRNLPPKGPTKTRPSSPACAKHSRCHRNSGTISWGIETTRRPAWDFGSSSISLPSSISAVDRTTRTVIPARSRSQRRRAASSPNRRLAKVARSSMAR